MAAVCGAGREACGNEPSNGKERELHRSADCTGGNYRPGEIEDAVIMAGGSRRSPVCKNKVEAFRAIKDGLCAQMGRLGQSEFFCRVR